MPNWVKRITKERAEDLGAAETLVAATYFQGRGSTMAQVSFGAASGIVGGAIGNRLGLDAQQRFLSKGKEGYNTFPGSMASRVPDDKGVLAVTSDRVIVFAYHQGALKTRIEAPVLAMAVADLVGWSYRSGKLAGVINLAFSDGSDVGIEVPRANRPEDFVTTLAIPSES